MSNNNIVGTLNVSIKDYSTLQYESIYEFPQIGSTTKLYIDRSDNATYRWDEDNKKYYCIGRDYKEIKIIKCGND